MRKGARDCAAADRSCDNGDDDAVDEDDSDGGVDENKTEEGRDILSAVVVMGLTRAATPRHLSIMVVDLLPPNMATLRVRTTAAVVVAKKNLDPHLVVLSPL